MTTFFENPTTQPTLDEPLLPITTKKFKEFKKKINPNPSKNVKEKVSRTDGWSSKQQISPTDSDLINHSKSPEEQTRGKTLKKKTEHNEIGKAEENTHDPIKKGERYEKETTGKETKAVLVVHTAPLYRTYIGVTVGFSVGVILLLGVWIWLWAHSGRTKENSPPMFRRSSPNDSVDMTCLIEENLSKGDSLSPIIEENKDLSKMSPSLLGFRKIQDGERDSSKSFQSSNLPLCEISTIDAMSTTGSGLYSYPLYYGYSLAKKNSTKQRRKGFFLPKYNAASTLRREKKFQDSTASHTGKNKC